ncbi:hypothetical protein OH807_31860 [Kitasatospora sp. NBC_01560]|uniref:RNA polymerase sigma factor n=1 Tax=Kitasatospora sp. NBC_01560 TaxID=2975965 RepID=UPI003869A325
MSETVKRGFRGLRDESAESTRKIMEDLERRSSVYKRRIRARIPREYVDDVWGEARLKMMTRLTNGEAPEKPGAYMWEVCRTCVADELAKINKRAENLIGDDLSVLETGVQLSDSAGYLAVKEVLDLVLTGRQHRAYVLTHVFCLNAREIAVATGLKHATVRKDLSQARRILSRPDVRARFDYRPREPRM